jgi:hypothetical protein
MKTERDAVEEVREWRRHMMEGWKGKSWKEIQYNLNEHVATWKKEREEQKKKEGAA